MKELNKRNIELANSNSFYDRGTRTEESYKKYVSEINSWGISDTKKQELLNKLHNHFEKILNFEAQHVPWTVAGPANYNAKSLDKSDKILEANKDFSDWFNSLKEQLNRQQQDEHKTTFEEFVALVSRQPMSVDYLLTDLIKEKNKEVFIYAFDYVQAQGIKKYRKNSNLYKIYAKLKNDEPVWSEKELIFKNEDYEAFIEDDRVFINFILKPKRQLIVALKSRGYWWNARKECWSTYINKLDKEWICSLSESYSKYI